MSDKVIEIDETGKVSAAGEQAARDLAALENADQQRIARENASLYSSQLGSLQQQWSAPRLAFADHPEAEQIQILRREILQLRATCSHLDHCLGGIVSQLQNLRQHEHVNGRVMVPADSGHPIMGIGGNMMAGSPYDPLA